MDNHLLRFDNKSKFVFIDCETYNLCLNSFYNRPWQVATLSAIGSEMISFNDLYIKGWPEKLIMSPEAAAITRFDPLKLERIGVHPKVAFEKIDKELQSADFIIGHNVIGFDIYLLKGYYEYIGRDWSFIMPKLIDTFPLIKGHKLNYPLRDKKDLSKYQYQVYHKIAKGVKSRLEVVGREFEIEHDYENLHDGLNDLKLNLKVWNKLKFMINI